MIKPITYCMRHFFLAHDSDAYLYYADARTSHELGILILTFLLGFCWEDMLKYLYFFKKSLYIYIIKQ